jgi:hypothetical protein
MNGNHFINSSEGEKATQRVWPPTPSLRVESTDQEFDLLFSARIGRHYGSGQRKMNTCISRHVQ